MAAIRDAYGRYQLTDVVTHLLPDGTVAQTFGTWQKPVFLTTKLSADKIGKYLVQTGFAGRPDLISHQVYGTPYLDWVLIAFNGSLDVLNWPSVGAIITYPLPSVVFAELI